MSTCGRHGAQRCPLCDPTRDILDRGRTLATDIAADNYQRVMPDVATVRMLCDEIAMLRMVRDGLSPPPAMRLAMYRQGIAAGVYSRMAMGQGMIGNIEEEAHAMLAAERVPK